MRHVASINASCQCVMSHTSMRHVTHVNASCHKCVMSTLIFSNRTNSVCDQHVPIYLPPLSPHSNTTPCHLRSRRGFVFFVCVCSKPSNAAQFGASSPRHETASASSSPSFTRNFWQWHVGLEQVNTHHSSKSLPTLGRVNIHHPSKSASR